MAWSQGPQGLGARLGTTVCHAPCVWCAHCFSQIQRHVCTFLSSAFLRGRPTLGLSVGTWEELSSLPAAAVTVPPGGCSVVSIAAVNVFLSWWEVAGSVSTWVSLFSLGEPFIRYSQETLSEACS